MKHRLIFIIVLLGLFIFAPNAFSRAPNSEDPNLAYTPQTTQKVQPDSIEPVETDVPHHFNAGDTPVLSSCEGVKAGKNFEMRTVDGRRCTIADGSKLRVISRTFRADSEKPKMGDETFIFEAHCKDGVRKFTGTDNNNPFTKFELEPGVCIDSPNGSVKKTLSNKKPVQTARPKRTSDR